LNKTLFIRNSLNINGKLGWKIKAKGIHSKKTSSFIRSQLIAYSGEWAIFFHAENKLTFFALEYKKLPTFQRPTFAINYSRIHLTAHKKATHRNWQTFYVCTIVSNSRASRT
jgi:hypothetical protein